MGRKKKSMLVFPLTVSLLLAGCSSGTRKSPATDARDTESSLTISVSELTQEPAFVDWTQDGTAMQLIACKDETGEVRLAFNTCQSCEGSPYAWFEYLGDQTLQCQNCGLTFSLDTVSATKAEGCNPVTITEFTVEGDTVTVPQKVLADNVQRFTNWKKIEE